MCALGHKRTFRIAIAMSALPPNSDIDCVFRHVCIGPKADNGLIIHLIGASGNKTVKSI
jgi:hypothetical protein